MKNLSNVQKALIRIFKAGIKEGSLDHLVESCHLELMKLMGEAKAKNFFLALHEGDSRYVFHYYKDEKDSDDPLHVPLSLEGGLTDYIRKSGRTERIDAERRKEMQAQKLPIKIIGTLSREWVGAPICYDGDVHGVLVVHTYDENIHYSDEDVQLLDYVSSNIALAIERKEREQALDLHRKDLEKELKIQSGELLEKNAELERKIASVKRSEKIQKVLFNISEAKSKTKDLKELLTIIHKQVDSLMDASNFYVAIVADREKGLYHLPYVADENPEELALSEDASDLSEGFTHYVVNKEKPMLVDQDAIQKLSETGEVEMLGAKPQSWLGIPLKTDSGETLGLVVVQSYTDPRAYTETDKEILSIISTNIADAVQHKQLEGEKSRLEELLLESQKMEAVGILAAGVAHEFNNLLSIIIGHAYNGMNACKDSPADFKRYSKIEKTGERAAELIEKLMVFAKKRERGRAFVKDLGRAVHHAVSSLAAASKSGCDIRVEIADDLWPVKIDREEIGDVLTNLLDNAVRAVEGKEDAQVTVSVSNFKGHPMHSPLKEIDRYTCIIVKDNGCGMNEGTRKHIFNPFFTTRAPGEGTGMGLAIVYTIVKEYYGCIDLVSEPDKGTEVQIYLPITARLS